MRSSSVHPWPLLLGAVSLFSECWGGLVAEPKPWEVFKDVDHSLLLPEVRWGSGARKISAERQIDKLSEKLSGLPDGRRRLNYMIAVDLGQIVLNSRPDFEESWREYMIKKESEAPEIHMERTRLRNYLYQLCGGEREILLNLPSNVVRVQVTRDHISVALDFHRFVMAWKSSRVYDAFG
ncbi:hypothetical protein Pst134EA_029236 [Puccinia striiformis f. sp. tritici]|uniref:hypothetical protein n=1 Tax=Puccinia striiformis f. sp. tritici TaxID=168172 RepID=UPI00200750C0|nr:hypothetical protein Pst134EA_029236 [Puccinia striiformis f. sp. tritici]KAH9447199.1 hypothetical protein Pst134EA_029236 [Puccinia striiformis f. sp. tritici]